MERRGSQAGEHPPAPGGATLAGGGKQSDEGLVAGWIMADPCRHSQKARPEPEDVPADTASEQMRSTAGLFWTRHRFSGSRSHASPRCWDVTPSGGKSSRFGLGHVLGFRVPHQDEAELVTPTSTNRDSRPRAPKGVWESHGWSPPQPQRGFLGGSKEADPAF